MKRRNVSESTDFASRRDWAGSASPDERAAHIVTSKLSDIRIGSHAARDTSLSRNGANHGETSSAPLGPLGGRLKRALDLVVSLSALVLASPIMLTIMAILALSGGSVFFVHERVGYGGQRFGCLKFRSMVTNPDEILRSHLAENADARKEWEETQKLKKDPRITLTGHIMRRSSIDELPQLLNIIRGEMSCVGPRPVTVDELERYGEHAEQYLKTRPGLTGLWQTSGRNLLSYDERVSLDVSYVTNWSLGSDLRILLKTVFTVLRMDQTS